LLKRDLRRRAIQRKIGCGKQDRRRRELCSHISRGGKKPWVSKRLEEE